MSSQELHPGTAAQIDLARTIELDGAPAHVILQQSLVIGGERCRHALFTLAGQQVDPEFRCQSEEIAPGVAVAFGKLVDQLLYAGGGLGDDPFLLSLPQRHFSVQRTFEQGLEVGRD
jgi:hypothetical protein